MLVEEQVNCAAAKGFVPDTRRQVSGRSHRVPPLSFRLARLPSGELGSRNRADSGLVDQSKTVPVRRVRTRGWEEKG